MAHAGSPRQARFDGFDLHANVWVPPTDRAHLEQLCRYLLCPRLAQDRVTRRSDGRVFVALKTMRRNGTTHLLFEPIEFLEKLAALIPRPAVNLLLYQGVLAPHARWRRAAVSSGRPTPAPMAPETDTPRRAPTLRAPGPGRR